MKRAFFLFRKDRHGKAEEIKFETDVVTLDDGRELYMTPAEMGIAREMYVHDPKATEHAIGRPFPDGRDDNAFIFDTLRTHERVMELLVTFGHLTPEQIAIVRKAALQSKEDE